MAGPRPQPQGPVCLSSPQVPGRCADPLARTVAVRASPIRPKTGVRAGAISGDSARCRRRTDLGLGARPSKRLLERRARSQRLPAPPSPSTAPSGTAGSAPFRRLFGQNLIDLGRSEKVGSPLILPRHEALAMVQIINLFRTPSKSFCSRPRPPRPGMMKQLKSCSCQLKTTHYLVLRNQVKLALFVPACQV